jgi:hypothetical protein
MTNPIWLVKTRLQLDRSQAGGFITVIKSIYSEQVKIAHTWSRYRGKPHLDPLVIINLIFSLASEIAIPI